MKIMARTIKIKKKISRQSKLRRDFPGPSQIFREMLAVLGIGDEKGRQGSYRRKNQGENYGLSQQSLTFLEFIITSRL